MSRQRFKVVAAVLATVNVAILTGCGSSSPDPGIGGMGPGLIGGCTAISDSIGFAGSNNYYNTMPSMSYQEVNLKAGNLVPTPVSSTYNPRVAEAAGTVVVTTGQMPPMTGYGIPVRNYSSVAGTIQINIQPTNYNPYAYNPANTTMPASTVANITGSLQISMSVRQRMVQDALANGWIPYVNQNYNQGYGTPGYVMPPMYNAYDWQQYERQICVNSLGISGYASYGGNTFAGVVILYTTINGSPRKTALVF